MQVAVPFMLQKKKISYEGMQPEEKKLPCCLVIKQWILLYHFYILVKNVNTSSTAY